MVDRRRFLKALIAGAIGGAVLSRLPARPALAAQEEAPELPWPYVKLDPEETRKLGHLGYYAFECAGGAFWSIVVQLKEKVGHPWTLLPVPSREEVLAAVKAKKHIASMMQYGYGGAVGWATLCGAVNGALAAIQMVIGEKAGWDKLGKALMRIYETTPLPTKKSNEYATTGKMYVSKLKSDKWLPQNISHSVLCHISVGKWCEVSGYASGSKERSERCARLTGDVAAFAVMLLNAYFDAYEKHEDAAKAASEAVSAVEYIVKHEYGGGTRLSATTAGCRTCHYKGKDYEAGQFTRGFLQCESCHRDMRPHAHIFFNPEAIQLESPGEPTTTKQLKQAASTGLAAAAVIGAVAGFTAGKAVSGKGTKKE